MEILQKENIFVMTDTRAITQDIRPLKVGLLNLMPLKEDTELQILRMLSNTPLQIDVIFVNVSSHESKNTSTSHLNKFYETFEDLFENQSVKVTDEVLEQYSKGWTRPALYKDISKFDIHDRVNYSVKKSMLKINEEKTIVKLKLTIDNKYGSVMDYFEIFLSRMLLCKKSAQKLGVKFALIINGQKMM